MNILEIRNASFGYDGKRVLRGINFALTRGDYLCVVGENGSGKSTLVKAVVQLLKPLSGEIIFGADLKKNEIGYLAQTFAPRGDFPAAVEEIVLSGRLATKRFLPFYSAADRAIARENLERLSIDDLRRRCFRELSGGQQRRVLLARALTASQKLLVIDEPTAGFDPIVAAEAHGLLKKINDELGVTIIMVSHHLTAALSQATKILHLKNRQLFFGAAAEYLNSSAGQSFLDAARASSFTEVEDGGNSD
jgi:zinc transport system ATP-binding protein